MRSCKIKQKYLQMIGKNIHFGNFFLRIILLTSGIYGLSQRRYNSFTLSGSQLSCDENFNYCIGYGSNYFATRLWIKSKNQFMIARNYISQCYASGSCTISKRYMAQDSSHMVIVTQPDKYLRVYTFNNSQIQLKQEISISVLNNVYIRNSYLIISSLTYFELYKYNSTTAQYSQVISNTITNGIIAFCITQDGSLMAFLLSSSNIKIYSKSGTTYTSVLIPIPSPGGVNYREEPALVKRNGTYVLILNFCDSGCSNQVLYYKRITATSMTLIQKIDQNRYNSTVPKSYTPFKMRVTNSGSYIILNTYQNSLFIYEYSSLTDTYNKSNLIASFPYSGWGKISPFSSENASFVIDRSTFYFACQLSYCQSCSWIGVCMICQAGYTLNNGLCGCGDRQSMVGGTCVDCSVENCAYCVSNNTCSNCSNGYSTNGSACECPTGSTISSTGACISCNISNCERCDRTNICALYSLSTPSNSNATNSSAITNSSASTNSTTASTSVNANNSIVISGTSASNGEMDFLRWAIVGLIAIVVVLGLGIIFILKKLIALSPNAQVHDTHKIQKRTNPNESYETKEIDEINNNSFEPQNVNSEIFLSMNLESINETRKKRKRKTDISMEDL